MKCTLSPAWAKGWMRGRQDLARGQREEDAAEQQQDAQALALLQKHHDFMGWQLGDGTFKTLRLTREYKNEKGELVTRREELRVNLAYRNTSTNLQRNVTVNDGFTGNVFWNTNWNGFTTPEYGDAAKYHLTYAAFFNEGLNALSARSRGSATVDGTDARIVRVS